MAVIFYPPRNTGGGGGAATWGSITGTLSAQTDLQTALNGKSDVGHTHTNLNTLVGFVTSEHITAPNNPVTASRILVTSSGANADFVLTSKGTGSILAQLADNAATGGNKRGINAVDLQMARSLATQVASGQNSALVGGASNTASGTRSGVFSGNANNVSSTNGAIVGGSSNTVSTNDNAAVVGGSNSTASGSGAAVVGAANSTATNTNAVVIGGSVNNATGLRSVVIGGDNNSASGQGSVAVGGTVNNITGVASVILGGTLNTNNGTECVILGSISSVIPSGSGVNAAILGGATHSNNASNSVILGGRGVTLTNTAGNSFCFHGANGSNTVPITIAAANTGVLNNVDLWLSNNDNTPRTLRFYEQYNSAGVFPNGTNYVAFRAPNSIATDVTWTLPNADGTNGQVLQTNGTGTLSWATPSGGGGSNVTLSYVRNIVNNLNTGFNFSFVPNGTQEVFGIASTGRVFWGVTDASSAVAYTAATVNGTYSQIALTNNGSGSGGFIFDIGPSAEGFVYYRSAAITNWTRWNGTSMVPVTTYPGSPGSVNGGTGLGYNGNFAFVAFATPEIMRYSTDNADTWANGSASWFHTSGTQHNAAQIAIGVVGSGSTWVIITQLNTNPVSANCSYGAINSTPTKQLFPNGYVNPQAFGSNGTVMYVYFENGMLGRTTDGANWTYLAVGNGEALTTFASWSLVIRSSDVLLISNAKVYSIAQDLNAVNWVRLIDNIGGTSGSSRKNHQKIGVISNELYIPATSGIVTSSIGYISSSIEKYTFA